MASYNCCISKGPPSPDGPAPRPIKMRSGKAPLKPPILAPSGSIKSGFSKTEDDADIRALFEADLSDSDDEQLELMRMKSSGTLAAVKSKLRKHLSCESALLRHQPRSTVRNSDGEVEQWKKVKLLGDKRIPEELGLEDSYDDDAMSLSTLTTKRSPSKAWNIGSENTMDSSNRKSIVGIFDLRQPDPLVSVMQRRHSSATLDKPLSLIVMGRDQSPPASSTVLVPPCPVLELQKLPSSAESATRRTSWRLSFASERRGTSLRALSQDYGASPRESNGSVAEVATGPLRWFRSQATRMSSPACVKIPNQPNQPGQVEGLPYCASSRAIEEDFGGVDGGSETNPPPVALHDMQISRRLASRGLHSHSSSPQLSSWGNQAHHRNHSSSTSASQHKIMNRPRFYRHNSSIGQAEFAGQRSWSDLSRDGVSSFYPSTDNIAQLSPGGSKSNLSPYLHLDKNNAHSKNVSYQTLVMERLPHMFSTSNIVDEETALDTTLSIPSAKHDRRSKMGTSIAVSETSSFRDREAEPNGIKTRFPFSLDRSCPSTPIKSKFKEHLDESQTPRQTQRPVASSILRVLPIPRVAKLASKSYDGASPLELQIPISRQGWGYEFTNRSRSTGGTVSPGSRGPGARSPVPRSPIARSPIARSPVARSPRSPSVDPLHAEEDEVASMWAQALKRSHHEHIHHMRRSLATRDKNHGRGSFLDIRSGSRKLKSMVRSSEDHSRVEEAERLSIESKDLELEQKLERKVRDVEADKQNTEEWVDELEARERQAKAKTEAVGREKSTRATILPESWARYPSHTRSERTTSAGTEDKVEQKDFAIKSMKEGVVEWMTGERKHHHHHHQKEKHHSLPTRVTNQIRATLYKLRTTKSSMMSDSVHGRKSSVSIGGKLEYPELELLPGEVAGYGLLEEVENETEAEMRRQERTARMVIFADGGSDGEFASEHEGFKLDAYETPVMSIADPKFYEDCVALPLEDENEDDRADSSSAQSLATVTRVQQPRGGDLLDKKNGLGVRSKYGTWSGRERTVTRLPDGVLMRRSTTDFQKELERMEAAERDRLLKAAAEAWA